jgi:hypothetical protein
MLAKEVNSRDCGFIGFSLIVTERQIVAAARASRPQNFYARIQRSVKNSVIRRTGNLLTTLPFSSESTDAKKNLAYCHSRHFVVTRWVSGIPYGIPYGIQLRNPGIS